MAKSAISPLAFSVVRSDDVIFWKSDGITTRNDIFETSTSGSGILFKSTLLFCVWRFILFDVMIGWSSAQFAWIFNEKKESDWDWCFAYLSRETWIFGITNQMAVMLIDASNNSNVHNHFVATFHTLEHDRFKTKSITERRLKYWRNWTHWTHLWIDAAVWFN